MTRDEIVLYFTKVIYIDPVRVWPEDWHLERKKKRKKNVLQILTYSAALRWLTCLLSGAHWEAVGN